MIRRRTGDDGVIATHMAITVAFALFAVTQLTRTTVAAQEIETRVGDIVGSVDSIDMETMPVAVLDETGRITDEILSSAMPLEGRTVEITETALLIDTNAKDILGSANTINDTAKAINGNVKGINSSVRQINSSVREIGSTAGAINANAAGILGSFQRLSPVVVGINDGVMGINQRADAVIKLSGNIKDDTGNILAEVPGINANARGICRSILIMGGSSCN